MVELPGWALTPITGVLINQRRGDETYREGGEMAEAETGETYLQAMDTEDCRREVSPSEPQEKTTLSISGF